MRRPPLRRYVKRALRSASLFRFFERRGVHVTPVHFYSPVPDTAAILADEARFTRPHPMPGVDLRPDAQLALLHTLSGYVSECDFPRRASGPHDYFIENQSFGYLSACLVHGMVRHLRPRSVVEIGSGYSTLVTARALTMNGVGGLTCIEPYPKPFLEADIPGLDRLLVSKAEDVDPAVFEGLEPDDIVFIDSSHVVRIGGDVNFLFLDVLPRLPAGVMVHVHDIFLPYEYPARWVLEQQRFWTEQYLLHALLIGNRDLEIELAGTYLYRQHLDALTRAFPPPAGLGLEAHYASSSFWMRKLG